MAKPVICYCTDWTLEVDEDARELRCTPSWRTFGKSLAATLLALILIGAQVFFFGMPPGNAQLSEQRDELEARQGQLKQMQQRASRLKASTGDIGKQMAQRLESQIERERAALQSERNRLDSAEPTLGSVGNAVYWSFFGLFVLLGILPPAAVFWERITLRADGRGGIEVVRRGQLARSHRFPAGSFSQMLIAVERDIHYSREHHQTEDKGWRWSVCLQSASDSQPPLIVCPEQEPTLPSQLQKTTRRVRQVIKFLSEATGVQPGPVAKRDVSSIRPGLFGAKLRGTVNGAGRADLSRHKPL